MRHARIYLCLCVETMDVVNSQQSHVISITVVDGSDEPSPRCGLPASMAGGQSHSAYTLVADLKVTAVMTGDAIPDHVDTTRGRWDRDRCGQGNQHSFLDRVSSIELINPWGTAPSILSMAIDELDIGQSVKRLPACFNRYIPPSGGASSSRYRRTR